MITVTANPTSIRLVMGDLWHTDLTMEQAFAFRSELDAAIRELRGGQFVPDVDSRDEAFHQNLARKRAKFAADEIGALPPDYLRMEDGGFWIVTDDGVEVLDEFEESLQPATIEVETAYGKVKHWQVAERPAITLSDVPNESPGPHTVMDLSDQAPIPFDNTQRMIVGDGIDPAQVNG